VLNTLLATAASVVEDDADRSFETVLLFSLLGLALTLAFPGLAPD